MFVDGDKTVPLPRMLDIDQYLDSITNRALPKPTNSADVQKALESLWSASAGLARKRRPTSSNASADRAWSWNMSWGT